MTYQDEKAEEKQEEKQEEKSGDQAEKDEKYHEKATSWQRDSLSGVIWALILIMAGSLLLLVNLDTPFLRWLDWGNIWGAILIGAALLLGAEVAIRLVMPTYARPVRGRIVLALILAFLGISHFTDVQLWPFIIIAIGISMLYQAVIGRGRR